MGGNDPRDSKALARGKRLPERGEFVLSCTVFPVCHGGHNRNLSTVLWGKKCFLFFPAEHKKQGQNRENVCQDFFSSAHLVSKTLKAINVQISPDFYFLKGTAGRSC